MPFITIETDDPDALLIAARTEGTASVRDVARADTLEHLTDALDAQIVASVRQQVQATWRAANARANPDPADVIDHLTVLPDDGPATTELPPDQLPGGAVVMPPLSLEDEAG